VAEKSSQLFSAIIFFIFDVVFYQDEEQL